MKLSSISLFGAALAAIVVSAIAAPVARSLEQANLFERDVDGELVDGLFPRGSEGQRRQARKSYIAMAEADCDTGDAQHAAFESYSRLFSLTEDQSHYHTARKHAEEGKIHFKRCGSNLKAATAAYYDTRTAEQKKRLNRKTRYIVATNKCKEEAIKSQEYAEAMIASHGTDHRPDHFKPRHVHLQLATRRSSRQSAI